MESSQPGTGTQMERFFERHKDGVVGKMHLLESGPPGVNIPDLPLTGVWFWASHLIPLNLRFLIWKMES